MIPAEGEPMPATAIAERARQLFTEDEPGQDFDWVGWLTPRHMRLFAVELAAALDCSDDASIQILLEGWQATAELDHSPTLQSIIAANRTGHFQPLEAPWLTPRPTA